MPLPTDFKNVSAELKYTQPVMTSFNTWSNKPTFGLEVHATTYGGQTKDYSMSEWWGKESWWPLSKIPVQKNQYSNYYANTYPLYAWGGDNVFSGRYYTLTFEEPVKVKEFTFQQRKSNMGNIYVRGVADGVIITPTFTVPNTSIPYDETVYTLTVPPESRRISKNFIFEESGSEKPHTSGYLYMGNDCEINGVYNPTKFTRYSNDLDLDYRQLDGISSSGNKSGYANYFIDSCFKPTNNTKFEIDFTITKTENSVGFGSYHSKPRSLYVGYSATENKLFYRLHDGATTYTEEEYHIDDRVVMLLDASNGTVTINGNEYTVPYTTKNISADNKFISFFGIGSNSNISNSGDALLHSAKIWDKENLVRDFVPAQRLRDGINGLYDKVEGKFYANSAVKNFVAHE